MWKYRKSARTFPSTMEQAGILWTGERDTCWVPLCRWVEKVLILNLATSYITVGAETATFSPEAPSTPSEPGKSYDVTISSSTGNIAPTKSGIYFEAPANDASYETDWTLAYNPVSADCVKVIRGGKEIVIGNVERGTIVKYGEGNYFLKTDTWTLGQTFGTLQEGDVLVISGQFKAPDGTMSVTRCGS